MSFNKRETKFKKEKKKQKISPESPVICRLDHRRNSTLKGLHIAVGCAPCIPPRKPPPFTPILDHSPNPFSLNTPSRYQSISSVDHQLNDSATNFSCTFYCPFHLLPHTFDIIISIPFYFHPHKRPSLSFSVLMFPQFLVSNSPSSKHHLSPFNSRSY